MNWPPRLEIVKRPNGKYWVVGHPDPTCPRQGPYTLKGEAEESKSRAIAFYRENAVWYSEQIEADRQEAELWYELECDKPAPKRGTPQWDSMWEDFCEHVARQHTDP